MGLILVAMLANHRNVWVKKEEDERLVEKARKIGILKTCGFM